MATVAEAAVAVCRDSLGDLRLKRVLILGAGQMALAAVREFQKAGAGEITVVNRSWDHAQQLARQCKVKAAHAESLWEQVLRADVVVSAASQRVLLTREELEIVLRERKDKHIVIVDLAVPRTVDPNVRTLEGVTAHDLDDLCAAMDQREQRRPHAAGGRAHRCRRRPRASVASFCRSRCCPRFQPCANGWNSSAPRKWISCASSSGPSPRIRKSLWRRCPRTSPSASRRPWHGS